MSKLFVNTIAPNSGDTVTVSGSLTTTGKLTIGDATSDTVAITAEITSSLIPDLDDKFDLGSSTKQWRNLWVDGTASIDIANIYNIELGQGGITGSGASNPQVSISGSVIPSGDNTYDLGSSAKEWKNLYIDGIAYIDQISGLQSINYGITGDNSVVTIGTASFVNITSSLIPSVDDQVSLGSSTKEWKDLYVDGTGYIDSLVCSNASITQLGTNLMPNVNGAINLGSTSLKFNLFAMTASFDKVSSSLIPDADDSYDLGSSTKQWKDLYVDGTANIDALAGVNTATITTLTATQLKGGANDHIEISSSINVSGSIQPNKDDTYDLGSSVRQWKDLYVDGVGYIDQVSGPSALITNISGSSISASTNLYVAGALKINKTTGASVDANTYSANGTKVEVRTQLQAQLNDGTFAHFYLLNTSVATDSIIVGSFTGGTAGAITASLLSANPIAASTASFRIHNETGGNVADNTGFTASFVIL